MGVGSYRQTVTICPDSITTMERFNILLVLDVSITKNRTSFSCWYNYTCCSHTTVSINS